MGVQVSAKTKEIIERLQALGDNPMLHETAQVCTGCIDNFSQQMGNNIFRGFVIDLLERSDPDEWTDEQLREYGLVRLPRDKDGEVISVGDVVWSVESGEQMMVTQILNGGSEGMAIRAIEHDYSIIYAPCDVTHHPPVTVESVLWDFADELLKCHRDDFRADNANDELHLIKTTAKRLRLAKDGE